MQIKEVLLQEEKEQVISFLSKLDLKYSDDITKTFVATNDSNEIIGTISCANYIIKDLGVDEAYQGENVSSSLISQMLTYFRENNIFSYQVFTKPKYINVFESFGFRKIVESDKVLMLEGGIDSIKDEINKIKKVLELNFAPLEKADLACVVLNANPITNGHVYLIEEALKKNKNLVVLVVEEDKSVFSFKERLSLCYLATKRFNNVYVMPSSKYVVSYLTFPDYFLKGATEKAIQNAKIDALIFREYFMKELHINKRYVGSEKDEYMKIYNDSLKEVLADKLEIIERIKEDGDIVSAKRVRRLFEEQRFEEALKYCPNECYLVLKSIAMVKYGSK